MNIKQALFEYGLAVDENGDILNSKFHKTKYTVNDVSTVQKFCEDHFLEKQNFYFHPSRTNGKYFFDMMQEALQRITGGLPSIQMLVDYETGDDNMSLQTWIVSQPNTPSWCQGIEVIDAARKMAESPNEDTCQSYENAMKMLEYGVYPL